MNTPRYAIAVMLQTLFETMPERKNKFSVRRAKSALPRNKQCVDRSSAYQTHSTPVIYEVSMPSTYSIKYGQMEGRNRQFWKWTLMSPKNDGTKLFWYIEFVRRGQSAGVGSTALGKWRENWKYHDISENGIWREIFSLKLCSWGRKHLAHTWSLYRFEFLSFSRQPKQ